MMTFDDALDEERFQVQWKALQERFLENLRDDASEAVRQSTRRSVEDMVEFMPKPELAKMAEALIKVTSLKRRVTQGMETVAGLSMWRSYRNRSVLCGQKEALLLSRLEPTLRVEDKRNVRIKHKQWRHSCSAYE